MQMENSVNDLTIHRGRSEPWPRRSQTQGTTRYEADQIRRISVGLRYPGYCMVYLLHPEDNYKTHCSICFTVQNYRDEQSINIRYDYPKFQYWTIEASMRYLSEIPLNSGHSNNQLISSTFADLGLVLPEVQ